MTTHQKPGPPIIGWEITNQCNLACPHCFSAAAKRPHNEMDTAECRAAIDAMARIGVGMIGWTGGEPLLRNDLEELTAYAKSRGIKSIITTNGVLLDESRAKSLIDAGTRAIQISLDGSTPELNWKMRRATAEQFDRIMDGIRICRKLGVKLFLATLLGEENLDDAREMMQLAKREGIDIIRFCGYTPVGRGKRADIQDRLQFRRRQDDLRRFIEEVQMDDSIVVTFDPGFGPVPPEYTFHQCTAGMETFYLKANGDVYPCTALLHQQFRVGNIRRRPLEEIWNDPAISAMTSYPRDRLEGPCRECDNFMNCHGACRGTAFAHTGNMNASLPVCLYQVARKAAMI
jgi:radical SAM protein with 4Fe4S-binding SPASM domain